MGKYTKVGMNEVDNSVNKGPVLKIQGWLDMKLAFEEGMSQGRGVGAQTRSNGKL